MELTIQIPDTLGQKLQPFQNRLPELLERGLHELLSESPLDFQEQNRILELLASQPEPEQILAIHPSPEFQARVSELLARNKQKQLSIQEEKVLDRHLMLEHLVRLAKAYAQKRLAEEA